MEDPNAASPLADARWLLHAIRHHESEAKRQAARLNYMVNKQRLAGAVEAAMAAKANAGAAVREEKDRMFHRHLAREMADAPRASEEEVRELAEMLHAAQRTLAGPSETPGWFKLFRRVDSDGSGLIDSDEFSEMVRGLLKLSRAALPESRLKAVWLALDSDCSGHISSGEFGAFLRLAEPPPFWGLKVNTERMQSLARQRRQLSEDSLAHEMRLEALLAERSLLAHEERAAKLAAELEHLGYRGELPGEGDGAGSITAAGSSPPIWPRRASSAALRSSIRSSIRSSTSLGHSPSQGHSPARSPSPPRSARAGSWLKLGEVTPRQLSTLRVLDADGGLPSALPSQPHSVASDASSVASNLTDAQQAALRRRTARKASGKT
jgi:hypothetical protein